MFAGSVCLFALVFIPLMEAVGAAEWRWQLLMTSHDGVLVFVIAFCHLQRVLRILVKSWGKSHSNNYCRANYQVGNI